MSDIIQFINILLLIVAGAGCVFAGMFIDKERGSFLKAGFVIVGLYAIVGGVLAFIYEVI